MSRFDSTRLEAEVFKLDVDRMRDGWYSDRYFVNIQRILATLTDRGERYNGSDPLALPAGVDPHSVLVGDLEV